MSRSLLVAFLAATFLVVPAALPIAFAPAIAPSLSGAGPGLAAPDRTLAAWGVEAGQPRGKTRRSSPPKVGQPA